MRHAVDLNADLGESTRTKRFPHDRLPRMFKVIKN
jgi:lactam utilization protein B